MGERRLHTVTVRAGWKLLGSTPRPSLPLCETFGKKGRALFFAFLTYCKQARKRAQKSLVDLDIYYDKKHVFATEIKSEKYTTSPRAPCL